MIDPNDIHSAAKAAPTDIDRLRTQARQRFIGAGVLVLVAVIGLPFILDTKPRPVSPNIAIDIPKAATSVAEPAPQATPDMASQPATSPALAVSTPAVSSPPEVAPTAAAPVAITPSTSATKDAPVPGDGYAIQAGSYTDKAKLAEAVAKLEKAGFAPYTQGAISKNGTHHTRVRLGPFATQQEANNAAVKVNKLGVKTIVIKPS
jgi:DedD protein